MPIQPAGTIVVGISGARRNAAAAVVVDGRLTGFCEEERISRIRGVALMPGKLPQGAVEAAFRSARLAPKAIKTYIAGEAGLSIPDGLPLARIDHHHAHAAAAFLTSPFDKAAVIVCDGHASPEVTVWTGDGDELTRRPWPWDVQGFASLFSECSRLFGFPDDSEHRLEALARLGRAEQVKRAAGLFRYVDGRMQVDQQWKAAIEAWLHEKSRPWSLEHGAVVASAVQHALGGVLLALAADIRRSFGLASLCLGGGLFYNTFFNTLVARSGVFDQVHIPPNPGNAGTAAGAALAIGRSGSNRHDGGGVSAFLGPEFELEDIKGTLDNCKLSYECLSYGEVVSKAVAALASGRLVGWFQGRMEWGHRALGNRSILASPLSLYVLDNLNIFLKQRERHRAYGLSVCEQEADRYFEGPPSSRSMEYQYTLKDPELFRHVLPDGARALRVQTVEPAAMLFQELHRAFAATTGTGVLVNTSFNGFSEPIVCSPRDAIRVFYGTGLDLLVLGCFVVHK